MLGEFKSQTAFVVDFGWSSDLITTASEEPKLAEVGGSWNEMRAYNVSVATSMSGRL